jgi:hypothetical protein
MEYFKLTIACEYLELDVVSFVEIDLGWDAQSLYRRQLLRDRLSLDNSCYKSAGEEIYKLHGVKCSAEPNSGRVRDSIWLFA